MIRRKLGSKIEKIMERNQGRDIFLLIQGSGPGKKQPRLVKRSDSGDH